MVHKSILSLVLLAAMTVASVESAEAAGRTRLIEIRWDFRQDPPGQLEVWENCDRKDEEDVYACSTGRKIKAPASYAYRIEPSDQVTLVVISAKTADPGFATYAITGADLDDKDLDALKKMFGAEATKAVAREGNAVLEKPAPKADVKAVTDPLIPGGKLTVTFSLKKTENGTETVTSTSGPLTFLIDGRPPRFTVSMGLGFSTAPTPTVVIAKTSTIVTFEKDGNTQQAYQQVIELRDDDDTMKPIQSLVTFTNFRIAGPLYASVGVQVNQKLFDGPIIGGTYRVPLGPRRGLNITAGVQFSKETEIDPATGFSVGQKLDPTLGLTVGDIKTKDVWHRRFALGLTVDF